MKKIYSLAFCLVLASSLIGQNSIVSELVSQGIELHDMGKFAEAIVMYKAALNIDKTSDLANYEIALSYASKGQYKDAIKHCNVSISHAKDDDLQVHWLLQ